MRPREQDSRNNIWIWLCLLCDCLPSNHLFFHIVEWLEWSSTNLARPQHAMSMYRRQMNTKSPDLSFIQLNMALLLSTHLFQACTHTNIFLMSLFLIFSIHQHCCESSKSWREPFSSSSFSYYIFHLQLISTALLSSHSAIIWHFIFLYLFPVHSHRSSNHQYTQERRHQELEYVCILLSWNK